MYRLLLFIVLLVGCIPAGEYYLVPAENITPDYVYCEGSECWSVKLVTEIPSEVPQETPTPGDFLTPTPEPAIPTVEPRGCPIQNQNEFSIRVRDVPNGMIVGSAEPDQYLSALAQWQGENFIWYKIWWDLGDGGFVYAWTAGDFYTILIPELKACQEIPEESPF